MQNELIKRYIPVSGIGTFMCCECIIEAAKNFVLDEFPEVIGIETHSDQTTYNSDQLTEIALKCLIILSKKFPPNITMFFLNGDTLQNTNTPGTIFIGCSHDDMKPDETKIDFIERVRTEIIALNVMRDKDDSDMDDIEKEHYKETFEIGSLLDISVAFDEKEDEEEQDDLDIGYANGISDGIEQQYYLVQVALYIMFKKKKIKDLDFMLEEIHNTISGMMGEDLKIWEKNFKKWTISNKKKKSHLEDDVEEIKKEKN
jgi:hypothetical protein